MESAHAVVRSTWVQPVFRVTGAGLLAATAAIHLDLYLTGFRNIPTIGPLFLLQVIAGFVLAAAVLATGNPVVAALGAGFAVATLAGYLLSVWVGLFGYTEVRTTAGIVAGLLEVAAFAVLGLFAVSPEAAAGSRGPGQGLARLLAGIPMARTLVAVVSVVALVLLLIAEAGAGAPAATAGSGAAALKTGKVGSVTVLTTAKGLTVYTFAADTTPGKSSCYGSCAAYWPPVTGTATVSPGVPGRVGTITRTGGSRQLTYNGHPLYTYIADTAPGQAKGNKLNINGGLWFEVTVP